MALVPLLKEDQNEELNALELKLKEFYDTCLNYSAFEEASSHMTIWTRILNIANTIIGEKGECRILELGAGRSGFGNYIKGTEGIWLASQDITGRNQDYLSKHSDEVIIGDIGLIVKNWDIIFCTYVLEHVVRPRLFLETVLSRLSCNGYLLIECPRYDIPLYIPPSIRHLGWFRKIIYQFNCLISDLLLLASQPRFHIFSDLAIFHLPFGRDRDAVYRVTRRDVVGFLQKYGKVCNYDLPSYSFLDFINKKFMTLRIIVRKT